MYFIAAYNNVARKSLFILSPVSSDARNVTEGAEEEENKNLEEEEAEQQESEDPLLAIGLAFMPKMNQEEAVLVLGLQQK
jgi:hypothetical protein